MIEPVDSSVLMQKMTVASYRVNNGTGDPWGVVARIDGRGFSHLTCDCIMFARKNWCNHVEVAYKDDNITNSKIEWSPAVVVFRSPVWLIVPTVIVPERPDTESPFYRVDVLWGDAKKVGSEFTAKGGETVGYISRSARRKAIRNLILEWLPALLYQPEAVTCTSNLHTYGNTFLDIDAKRLEYERQDDVTKRRMLADAFNILDTGSCSACYTAFNIPF